MRSSMISASAFAAGMLVLAACSSQNGIVPSSQSAVAPMTTQDAAPQSEAPVTSASSTTGRDTSDVADASDVSPALTTCDTSPPQYWWIFKGACDTFVLKPAGGSFKLGTYNSITVTGSIGKNNVKTSAKIALADATDKNGDIKTYKGKTFPAYRARGTTFVYAAANNEGKQTIKPILQQGHTVLKYVITDSKGLPGKTCGAALLGEKNGKFQWTGFPDQYKAKGNTVTISVFTIPTGFQLPPAGTPLYFAVNCY